MNSATGTGNKSMVRRGMVIFIVIVGLGTFTAFLYRLEQRRAGIVPGTTGISYIDTSTYSAKTYSLDNPYVSFDVQYPAFSNAPESFNDSIEQAVLDAAASDIQDARENWQARYKTQTAKTSKAERIGSVPKESEKMPFAVSYTVAQSNDAVISVLLHITGFTGGAHGYDTMLSFNYDVAAKKPVVLADVYAHDPNFLKTISSEVRDRLSAQLSDNGTLDPIVEGMIADGTAPVAANFKTFTLSQDTGGARSITFYFAQYQVAPYVYGQPQVTISLR